MIWLQCGRKLSPMSEYDQEDCGGDDNQENQYHGRSDYKNCDEEEERPK